MATVEGHSTDRSVNTYGLFVEVAAQFIPHHLGGSMLYDAYEMQRSLLAGASTLANIGAGWMQNPVNPFDYSSMGPIVTSALDVFAHVSAPRGTPEFRSEEHTSELESLMHISY